MPIMHSLYREAGTVAIDSRLCKRCTQCVRVCAAEVLTMEDGIIRVKDSPFGCIACGHCMMICPNEGLRVTGRGISPEDLLPLPPKETRASPESLAALMLARRSVRLFQEKEVPTEILDRVVEMASSAPMGIPPWDVGCAVLGSRRQVRALAERILKGYEGFLRLFRPWVLALMRPFIGKARYEQLRHFLRPLAEMYVGNRARGRDVLFYDAPALMIFHHSAYAGQEDAVIACTYAMLAAESFGLGTTMIGAAAPMLQRDEALSLACGIPAGNKAALVLILGWPGVKYRRAIRRRFTPAQAATITGSSA